MKALITSMLFITISTFTMAQEHNSSLPYYQIPNYTEEYTATAVVARMIDGLGFRYYWATEGLQPEDLAYKPSPEARTSEQTIDHILGLTHVIINAVTNQPNGREAGDKPVLTFDEKRAKTLDNIKRASDILKQSSDNDLENFNLVFQRGDSSSEFPFWNLINGPIADAIWHAGQIVSLRRASGNPFDSNVSLMRGKRRE